MIIVAIVIANAISVITNITITYNYPYYCHFIIIFVLHCNIGNDSEKFPRRIRMLKHWAGENLHTLRHNHADNMET